VKGAGATKLAAWAMLYAAQAAQAGLRVELALIVPIVATLLLDQFVGDALFSQPLTGVALTVRPLKTECTASND
jgi:hypothetical protein